MTHPDFRYCISFELSEIAEARDVLIAHEAALLLALDHGKLSDAQEAARLSAIKASQLQIMLAHISAVIGLEIERQAENFEDATQVYEGKVA